MKKIKMKRMKKRKKKIYLHLIRITFISLKKYRNQQKPRELLFHQKIFNILINQKPKQI